MAVGNVSTCSSALELSTDVSNAVEKLQELRTNLKISKTAFTDEFCSEATSIISSLKDLDAVRLKAHDKLEVESITSSVLRHRLAMFTSLLRKEAADAVNSARQANAAQLKQLQDKIDRMNSEASDLVKKHEVFDLHNERILQELAEIESKQREKIKSLNEKMSERASLQILLNETSDQLQSTNDKIKSLNDEMESLEKMLQMEKDEFNKEKDRLLKMLDATKAKLNEKSTENDQLKIEFGELQDELVNIGFSIHETKRKMVETEAEIDNLLKKQDNLRAEIIKTERENAAMVEINKGIEQEIKELEMEFTRKHKEALERMELLMKEVEQAKEESKALRKARKDKFNELQEAVKLKEEQLSVLTDIRKSVDDSKKLLLSESEAGIVLMSEKKELEYRLLTLKETHKVTIQILKEEILELKEKVTKERRTRETFENSYNALQADIQQRLTQHSDVMNSLNEEISSAESEERIMQDRADQLELEIKTFNQNIEAMTLELESLTERLKSVKCDLEDKITATEEMVAELKEENIDHDELRRALEPEIETLENTFETLSEEYENRKKNIITLKNKKAGLEDTCTRLERNLAKMPVPQDKLRMETISCRASTRSWLEQQRQSVQGIEEKVTEGERKLNNVTRQNERFLNGIEMLQNECHRLSVVRDRSKVKEIEMMKQLANIKVSLDKEWKENKETAKNYSEMDKSTVGQLTSCAMEWQQRDQWLKDISSQFDSELDRFSHYLHQLANQKQSK